MPIEFRCAECATTYDVDDDLAGKTIRCRECHGLSKVPAPISCTCSWCGARIRAPEKLAGCKAKCPKCQAEILVPIWLKRDAPLPTAAKSALEALAREESAPQVRPSGPAEQLKCGTVSELPAIKSPPKPPSDATIPALAELAVMEASSAPQPAAHVSPAIVAQPDADHGDTKPQKSVEKRIGNEWLKHNWWLLMAFVGFVAVNNAAWLLGTNAVAHDRGRVTADNYNGRLSASNYSRIYVGMPRDEAERILGPNGNSIGQLVHGPFPLGSRIPSFPDTVRWQENGRTVVVVFFEGLVQSKNKDGF
jgi:hypothetical protein